MSLKTELLEQSFAAVAPKGDELAETFYRHLLIDFPEVRPLFKDVDMSAQKNKLLAALKLVVNNLRHPSKLVPALEELGGRHVDYGAREEHYPAVGETLLKSMSEVAGDQWNENLKDAWTEAYKKISEVMVAGMYLPAN